MHNLRRRFQAFLVLLLLGFGRLALGDVFEECNEENDQQFLFSPKGCTYFILCNGEDSHEGECPEGDRFNPDEQMCELMEDIDCRTGLPIGTNNSDDNLVIEEEITAQPVDELENETTAGETASTAQPTAAEITSLISVASTTSTPAPSTASTIVASSCPSIDNPNQIVLIAHDKSCTEYFICYRGQPISMSCAAMLHFNVKTGKCDRAEIVKCMVSGN